MTDKIDFADKMKKLRCKKNISLLELAAQTGFTAEYLEQIENNQAQASLQVVSAISEALAMPGKEQAAVKKAENQQRLSAKKRQKSFEMRMENVFYETLTPKSRANHLTAFKITIQPFMEHQMVAYHHPGEEFLYVLSGELELNVSRRIQRLGAHQCFQFDSAKAHRLKSISSEPTVVLVVIYAP